MSTPKQSRSATQSGPGGALSDIRVDGDRLWASLMEMARIGATPKGGVNRLTLTDGDRESRDLFIRWCEDAGCTVTVDEIGNIFARRPGRHPDRAPILAGSHLDTQPTGGKFDGCYGVLAGLEVLRTLNDHGMETDAPVEVVVWTNEEGSRFPPCMMGSGVFSGRLDIGKVLSTEDVDGNTAGDELRRIGYAGAQRAGDHPVGAYFEAHIEQGPILEDEQKTIGVVLGALGQKWFDLTLTGQEAHAGPTPMHLRKDALLGAAELVSAVNRIALDEQPHGRGTVGSLRISPDSRNVIPGSVHMSVDFRHLESNGLDRMAASLHERLDDVTARHSLTFELEPTADFPPLQFDPDCVEAVRDGARGLGIPSLDIVSGAGHDAIYLAGVAPAGMIFVPCENGISHNEIENAKPGDLAAGCDVLFRAMMRRAGTGKDDARA